MLRKKENQAISRDGNDHMEAKYHHRRTCIGPLLRSTGHLSGPEQVAHTQIMENHHEAMHYWRTKARTQSAELSTTSWNPDTLNHGKLERFLACVDADFFVFQGTRLRMRTIPKDGKARDDTITPVRSEWCSKGYQIFSWCWSSGEFSNHACGVLIAIREATFGAGQIVQRYDPPRSLVGRMGGIRVKSRQRSGCRRTWAN